MARFILATLCVVAAFSGASADLDYGLDMLEKAYSAVCWYETLGQFPNTNSEGYGKCSRVIKDSVDQVMDPNGPNAAHFAQYPDQKPSTIANGIRDHGMKRLPADYGRCTPYLGKLDDAPPADESDALNDPHGASGGSYPFKAFNYCLLQTLRQKHGNPGIDAIKNERTHKRKHWRKALLDRENAFRALHGAKPLKLIGDLNDAATAHAQWNAKICQMKHSENTDAGRQWNGATTGENLAVAGGKKDDFATAYIAADGWYEENKDYPWPAFQGDSSNPLFKKIGHFTQSVWDESEYVGYGYAYNENCKKEENFIAARYSPPGNRQGKYGEHVKPKH